MYKLLVVDDEELERKVLVFTLQNSGLPVEIIGEAGSGRDAIELARAKQPDLILMDIKMPGIDGIQATHQIKEECPATEIIILTAYGKFSYSQQAIKAQASDYLLKPIHPQQLIEAVEKALKRLSNKKIFLGPTLDMADFAEQVKRRNQRLAEHSLQQLLNSFQTGEPSPSAALLRSFGFKLLVFAVQSALETGVEPARLRNLEEKLLGELEKIASQHGLAEWGQQMLAQLFDLITEQGTGYDAQAVRQAIEYLERNYRQDLSLSQVAGQVHLSPSYLSRIFVKKTGTSFTEYISRLRIKNAKHRLASSTDTIDQIAVELGFSSNSYFTAVFKKYEGMTPSEFRLNHLNKI